MSANKAEELEVAYYAQVCASCGIAAVDDITLKFCDDCDLVKYCSDECQENHREQHKEECKKRKAELHGKKLFTQPDISHHGECPICCLPLPIGERKSKLMTCCCKWICKGCCYANVKRVIEEGLERRCVYCREPAPESGDTEDFHHKRVVERIKKNDPVAMTEMGKLHYLKEEYAKSLELWTKAAELEDVDAHFRLATLYYYGKGVEKDENKAVYHSEQAAICGHPDARYLLACYEEIKGRSERAAKHLIISANLGCDLSLKYIKTLFVAGVVSKDEYAAALRGYQTALNETKSAEREEGEEFYATIHK
jgi:tetratricopeptide (TPR) repeat protein